MKIQKVQFSCALLALLTLITAGVVRSFSENRPAPASQSDRLLRDASMMLLKEGNARFAAGKSQHPNLDAERRNSTVAQGQEPFATILACSDSRDPVELIFDRGVGDLFVVRVAGNVAGPSELASIEYGVGHLHTSLLVVMGHTKCGAVTAAVKGAEVHGHIPALIQRIKPAAERAKQESSTPEELIPAAIRANVWQTIADTIKQSSQVRELVVAGKLQILGAVYDLETGKVTWLGVHPGQEELLTQSKPVEPKSASAGPPLPKPSAYLRSGTASPNVLPLAGSGHEADAKPEKGGGKSPATPAHDH
jgi:carbonic anhydrase